MEPADIFRKGPGQDEIISGIKQHGYDAHPKDRIGMSRDKFGEAARRDLNNADRAMSVKGDDQRVLFGNTKSGMFGAANLSRPDRSTYFKPSAGVDRYLANCWKAAV